MVRLVPMDEEQYHRYLEGALPNYAQEMVQAGNWPSEDAANLAEKSFQALLPDGLASADQYLCLIVDEQAGEQVGFLWYGVREGPGGRFVALYDIVVFEEHRRRGYGAQALHALEVKVRELGLDKVMLHVFGHNQGARALYRRLGYAETDVTMAKTLRDAPL